MFSLKETLYELLSENREAQAKKLFVNTKKLDEDEFEKIYAADPSPSKKYVLWLMEKYYKEVKEPYVKNQPASKDIPQDSDSRQRPLPPEAREKKRLFFEDLPAVTEALDLFIRVGHKFPHTNIQDYKTVEDFRITADKLRDELSPEELEKGKVANTKYPELVIGKVKGFTVYKFPQNRPDLKDISIDLGQGFGWCTDRTDNMNQYNQYNKNDAIYKFMKGKESYQHDQYSGQWKGRHNATMTDDALKAAFIDFLGDVDGRIYDANQLAKMDKYLIGHYTSQGKKYPFYKVGNKYYTIAKTREGGPDEALYYDPDIKKFKDTRGRTKSHDFLFKYPYIDFLKAIYYDLKKQGNVKVFNNVLRLFLDLDVPKKPEGEWYKIGGEGTGNVDLSDTDLTSLPENLWILGDLNIEGSKIKELPKRIRVDGTITK